MARDEGITKHVSERWYTVEEIVTLLHVHEQTVRRWLKNGELHGVLLGRKAGWRIRASELQRFLDERDTAKQADRRE